MKKLIELLNEYEKTLEPNLQIEWTEVWIKSTPEIVISKKFWFIKWLVENEKIDSWTRNPLFITELVGEQEKQIPYSFYEEMLIRLALSDTPIEDLISYLK